MRLSLHAPPGVPDMSGGLDTSDMLQGGALACLFFSRIFHMAPEADFLLTLREQGMLECWPLPEAQDHARQGLLLLRKSLENDTPALVAEDFTTLFFGPEKPLRQWESTWTTPDRLLFGEPAAEVRQCYARHGITTPGTDPEDHIALELAFLGNLLERAVRAGEEGRHDEAAALTEEAKTFYTNHLGRFAESFLREMELRAGTDFYRGAALLCRAMLHDLAGILTPRPGGLGSEHG